MYAVIKTGGKQYRVEVGDELFVEKIPAEVGETVSFPVLALTDDAGMHLGDAVAESKVTAEVVKQGKHKKIYVMKYKAKKNYRRKTGHRQPYTRVRINEITL